MLKHRLQKDLKDTVLALGYKVSDIVISIPKNSNFGDYSTNIALQLSKQKTENGNQSPTEIANDISRTAQSFDYIEKVEIAGGGFLNLFLKKQLIAEDLREIIKDEKNFGKLEINKGKKARVEFVSANPTGPLHFGNGRGGPLGDVVSAVLEFTGYKVLREYIDNDRGNQISELGKTIASQAGLIKANQEELTYKGEYIKELAPKVLSLIGKTNNLSETEIIAQAGDIGVKLLFEEILKDTKDLGINYDLIVHESELQKQAPKILAELQEQGLLKEADGAVWFAPKNQFLGDNEAVVIKSDGSYTYFTADVVYHKEKFESGYDLVVDVFGSNTSGHVPKLQALAMTFGYDLAKFRVIMYQFVRIKRGDEVVKMSKRAGNFITVREVLDEVGKDAFRFLLLRNAPQTHIDFDLELVKEQSSKNPVFFVQYAYARMSNILNKSQGLSVKGQVSTNIDYGLLSTEQEINLIKHLLYLPEFIEELAQTLQVHQLTEYAITLAELFHKFYEKCPVLVAETADLKLARLMLVKAAQITLGNTLKLLGVSAPERM